MSRAAWTTFGCSILLATGTISAVNWDQRQQRLALKGIKREKSKDPPSVGDGAEGTLEEMPSDRNQSDAGSIESRLKQRSGASGAASTRTQAVAA
jgi:hypothetical protein